MRPGDIVASIVVTILAVIAFVAFTAGPACGCTPALDGPPPPSFGSVAQRVARAQAEHHGRTGTFAATPESLAFTPQAGFIISDLDATPASYHLRIAGTLDGRPRACTMTGSRPDSTGAHSFTLDCDDDGPAPR